MTRGAQLLHRGLEEALVQGTVRRMTGCAVFQRFQGVGVLGLELRRLVTLQAGREVHRPDHGLLVALASRRPLIPEFVKLP